MTHRTDIGDGDVCPVTPSHGRMLVLSSGNQHCPHVEHAGRPKSAPGGATPPTRFLWPAGMVSFPAAVAEWKEQHA